jgi:hypothetical protein
MSANKPPLLTVRAALILIVAVILGVAVGVLVAIERHSPIAGVLAGAGGFGAAIQLLHEIVGG